jgi:hypothetical protein
VKSANITGYREMSEQDVALINKVKAAEQGLADLWQQIRRTYEVDGRQLAMARTDFENGFYHLVRSIAKPESPFEY